MRIPNWPALVCGWTLAAMIGQTVLAADPDDEVPETSASLAAGGASGSKGGSGSAAGGNPYQPAQFVAGGAYGGGYLPPAGGYGAAGLPAQNAWPETSPFTQHRIEETFNEGGVWQYNSDDNFDRKWIFGIDYLYGHGASTGKQFIGDSRFRDTTVLPGDVPGSRFLSQDTRLYSPMFHDGMRVRYGYENPDDSGMMLSGFLLFQNSESNKKFIGNEVPGNLQTLASIIVNNGDGTAIALPFDTRFFQQFTQEIMGADADYYFSPFYTRSSFKVKMLVGAKYLRVSENFFVQADDSGLGYTITGTSAIAAPITQLTAPYSAIINSSTTSNLVGPALGLRYDLGGDKLKLWGMSKFGVMADIESRTVSSANLNQFKTAFPVTTVPTLTAGPFAGLSPSPTRVTGNNTHMAALFDQQFNLEFPLFSMLPVVNRMALFKDANFRVGWQYVVVSEIARAANQINYDINQASINSHRSWFSYNVVNFGVNWKW